MTNVPQEFALVEPIQTDTNTGSIASKHVNDPLMLGTTAEVTTEMVEVAGDN